MMEQQCQYCGMTPAEADQFGLLEVRGYDYESADDTALSVPRLLGYRCANVSACARRVVERGTSIDGLLMVVETGREHLDSTLVDRAHELLRAYADISRQQAEAADQAAREAGWGVIGGPMSMRR
jgi:hypothetical protein